MNYEVMLFVYCALVADDNVVKVVFRCSCCFVAIVIENCLYCQVDLLCEVAKLLSTCLARRDA